VATAHLIGWAVVRKATGLVSSGSLDSAIRRVSEHSLVYSTNSNWGSFWTRYQ
jgi:hypothetical protein